MNTRSRLMLEALNPSSGQGPSQRGMLGYAEGGLVQDAGSAVPVSSLVTTPDPLAPAQFGATQFGATQFGATQFAPRPLRPTYGALNADIAGLRSQRPMFGTAPSSGFSPMFPVTQRPMFGQVPQSAYNFTAPAPQVRAPTQANNDVNDFYARQAQLAESIRAADSAQRRATMVAIARQQFEARMQADLLSPNSYARSGGGGSSVVGVTTPGGSGSAAGATVSDINRLYRELLGRDADPTGLAANKGASLDVIRKSIMDSAEYKAKNPGGGSGGSGSGGSGSGGSTGTSDITRLYQELLGRAPDPTGIAANQGASAEAIRQSILNSAEYQSRNAGGAGGGGGGIEALYRQMLGRAPDPTGIAANVGQSDEAIRQSIAASPEYQARNPNIDTISNVYQELLGRAPDPTGIAANQNASEEEIRQSILNSAEYQEQRPWYNDNTG